MADSFFTQQKTYTPDQYRSGPVDYYAGSLGTGIDVDVIEEDTTKKDPAPDILNPAYAPVSVDSQRDPRATTQVLGVGTMPTYDVSMFGLDSIKYTDYSTKAFTDKTDNFVTKALKSKKIGLNMDASAEAAIAPANALLGPVLGTAAGTFAGKQVSVPFGKDSSFRPAGLGGVAFDVAMSFHAKNAAAVQANRKAGGNSGALMTINNMLVSRKPGSFIYTGNLGNLSNEQVRNLEATSLGFVAGTLKDEKDPSSPSGFKTTGMKGLLDAEQARMVGGNISETGYFINSVTGMGAKLTGAAGLKNKEYAAAFTAAQNKYGVTQQQFNFSLAEAQEKTGLFGTVRVQHRDKTFLSDALQRYADANKKAVTDALDQAGPDMSTTDQGDQKPVTVLGGGTDDMGSGVPITDLTKDYQLPPAERPGRDPGDEPGGDHNKPGGGRGESPTGGDIAGTPFKSGGRVGLQEGGVAAAPAGFVERPPSQVSEAATVADDKPMSVPEGTFVINAAAVEYAGEEDIMEMLNTAYKKAEKKGIQPPSKEKLEVAVSRGEVIVPPFLAKIIGYDRLEKINNRGKKETNERIKDSEVRAAAQPGMFLGGLLDKAKGFLGMGEEEEVETLRPPKENPEGFVSQPSPSSSPSAPLPKLTPFEEKTQELLQILEDNKFVGYIPTNNSGVTIGRGFDVGQHSVTDLERMGLNSAIISKLTPYVGSFNEEGEFVPRIGQAAKEALERDPLSFDSSDPIQAQSLEDMNITVQRRKYEDFVRVMKNKKFKMPKDDAARAAVFSEFYHGAFATVDGKFLRQKFMDEIKKHGNVYKAFEKGVHDLISNENSPSRTRAEKAQMWYLENAKDLPVGKGNKIDKLILPKPKPERNLAGGGFITRKKLANGGEVDEYEDKIIRDEVRRKMDVLMDEVAARNFENKDDPITVISEYFKSDSAQKEYADAMAERYDRAARTGNFYYNPENKILNVPKTPTLANLLVMAEEVAHMDVYEPGNPMTRKNPYPAPEYSLFKDFNKLTGDLFRTPVMGEDFDPQETFDLEGEYLEEMRAKQIAFQTVFGGLAQRQAEKTKAGRTLKYTRASYEENFADYITAFASPVVKAAFFKKYPNLKRVYREVPVDEELRAAARKERFEERLQRSQN